jgi:hypothetical protein
VAHRRSHLADLLSVVLAAGAGATAPASAQAGVAPRSTRVDPAASATVAPGTNPSTLDAGRPAEGGGRLLREGSYLVEIKGILHRRPPSSGWWHFQIGLDVPGQASPDLPILPCSLLARMQELVESAPGQETFELTAEIFEYRGRNYLLPTHGPRLLKDASPRTAPDHDEPGAAGPSGDTAQEILRDLDRAVGPVPGAPGTAPEVAQPQGLLTPDTIVLWRRGHMMREPQGAWSFVFDADANGLADPPVILLPCLRLERMERYAQRSTTDAPLLVSGRVHSYHGRSYLLPTAFRIPRERTPLRP